jgi:Sec-independent protein translocase protein TatA
VRSPLLAEDRNILEILLLLLVAVIVIPPERLPEVMRTTGKVLRELRLASNTVVRELASTLDEPPAPVMRPRSPLPAATAAPTNSEAQK